MPAACGRLGLRAGCTAGSAAITTTGFNDDDEGN